MAELRQLQMVLELREREQDKALDNLRQARSHWQHQQQQLQQLQQYRQEYCKSMLSRGQQGLDVAVFSQFQGFIARIDESVAELQQAVTVAEQVVNQREQLYRQAKANCDAVQVLIDKAQRTLAQREARQEQRLSDEWALRGYRTDTH